MPITITKLPKSKRLNIRTSYPYRMTLDSYVDFRMDQYREHYANHFIHSLDLPDIQKYALRFINRLQKSDPQADLDNAASVIAYKDPEKCRRRLDRYKGTFIEQTPYYTGFMAEYYMVTNPEFRERMLGIYNTAIQPQLERFEAYDSELEKLTRTFMYSLSRDELADFTETYRGYRRTDDERIEDYLSLLDPEYADLIRYIHDFEQEYQDLIEHDIVNVRDKAHAEIFGQPLDMEDDSLRDLGILFPYLNLYKTLYDFPGVEELPYTG